MPWYDWLYAGLALYGVVGIAGAVFFNMVLEEAEGWFWTALFWPVFWVAFLWDVYA